MDIMKALAREVHRVWVVCLSTNYKNLRSFHFRFQDRSLHSAFVQTCGMLEAEKDWDARGFCDLKTVGWGLNRLSDPLNSLASQGGSKKAN